ncbi:MAG: PAS domain S-box protein [Deltaproteobacteria bacterium]|nr:PAS domain S-box protein [Deltaproteobacteria bacterium]
MVEQTERPTTPGKRARIGLAGYVIGLGVLWTIALSGSLGWGLRQQRQEEKAAAAITARVSYESDVKYLSWLSALGGLYVHAEVPFPPDPHLGNLSGRELHLPDGKELLPVTPIYVLRLVHALDIVPLEVSSRLRSLTPVVPDDIPDPWEEKALSSLSQGHREVVDVAAIDGENFLRLMVPLRIGKDCVSCHAREGYKEGALQGGISVTVPMDRPAEFGRRSDAYFFAAHGMLWLLGVGFLGYGFRSLSSSAKERDRALASAAAERAFSDSVVDTAGALVLVTDPEGRVVRFNRACEAVTGYTFDEVCGKPVWELLLPSEDRESFRRELERLSPAAAQEIREVTWITKDGSRRTVAWAASLLLDDQGVPKFFIASGVDVTQRKRVEEALSESVERLSLHLTNTPLAYIEWNRALEVTEWNPTAERIFGYTREEALSCSGDEIIVPSDASSPGSRTWYGSLDGGSSRITAENVTKDGDRIVCEWYNTPLRDTDGSIVGMGSLVQDVTERSRAEESLRESEERYRTLVENIDMGITLVDEHHRILMANPAHASLLKKVPSDEIGDLCFRVVHGRETVCPDCPGTLAMDTGKPASREIGGVRADGSPSWIRVQAFPVTAPDGTAKGFIEVVEDLTEAKRLRDERDQLERKMLQAQKLESLGVLAGGIAHDFNNLLMGILGNVDLALLRSKPDAAVRPYLQRIDTAAQRAADLTNQMLAYSGKGRFLVEPVDLSRLVGEMEHLLNTILAKTARVVYRLSSGPPAVLADATQLRQVVMNLITNASDALGTREGVVTVSTGVVEADRAYLSTAQLGEYLPEGPYVYVEVSDTGTGMDAATRARIFDPFFTTKERGRGLGLAAVLGIVKGHRGALKVYSEPGRGTTFKVLFPTDGASKAPNDEARALLGPTAPDRAPTAQGTLLVVDDEEDVRIVARDVLEESGFTVLTASDGVEGVETFRRHAQDIIAVVLDMTMPRMGGEEAFRAMREIREDVAVLLSSGYNEQDAVERFTGSGAVGFVQKPYRAQTLLDKLAEVLGGGVGNASGAPAAG